MRKFFKNKPLLIAIAAILVLVILAVSTVGGGRTMTWIESTVSSVTQPIQTFATNVSIAE